MEDHIFLVKYKNVGKKVLRTTLCSHCSKLTWSDAQMQNVERRHICLFDDIGECIVKKYYGPFDPRISLEEQICNMRLKE